MAVQARQTLDAQRLRADFPVFDELVNGKPVAYLDSASSTQKPRQVLDAMREFYEHSYANVHRGVYTLAERATAGYEGAREKVRAYVNAPSNREVIFTRSVSNRASADRWLCEHHHTRCTRFDEDAHYRRWEWRERGYAAGAVVLLAAGALSGARRLRLRP